MGDLDGYLEAKNLYERVCNSHPEVIRRMKDQIDIYAESRDDVYSTQAGRAIIPKDSQFRDLCGDKASQVFGIILRDHLTASGRIPDTDDDRGKKVKVYRRR